MTWKWSGERSGRASVADPLGPGLPGIAGAGEPPSDRSHNDLEACPTILEPEVACSLASLCAAGLNSTPRLSQRNRLRPSAALDSVIRTCGEHPGNTGTGIRKKSGFRRTVGGSRAGLGSACLPASSMALSMASVVMTSTTWRRGMAGPGASARRLVPCAADAVHHEPYSAGSSSGTAPAPASRVRGRQRGDHRPGRRGARMAAAAVGQLGRAATGACCAEQRGAGSGPRRVRTGCTAG